MTETVNGHLTDIRPAPFRSSYRPMAHLAEILARIEKRLTATGLSASAASKAAGKSEAIRNLQRAVEDGSTRQGMTTATINALAPVLGTTSIWLFAGAGPEEPGGTSQSLAELAAEPATPSAIRRFVRPAYGGVVEAGSFRQVSDFDDDPERMMPLAEEDPRFPGVPIISFDVAGDSMNALQPTPLLPGQRVIAIDFEGLKNRVPLRDGMVVVVEQTLQGGHLRERSVKQLEMHRDRTEFCPRSTNPKHKPIVVPYETVDQGDEDGREVKVLAIVMQFVSNAPGW